jgi:hypothetical protein
VPDRSCSEFDVLVLGDCNPDLVLSGDDVEPQFGQIERLVDAAELTIGGGTTAQPTLQEALAA